MAYLKTIITYNQPSEAEVDKAFLESQGFAVCLLNGNTARNELGAPFYIQLQVADADFVRARDLLKATNPQRFGSAERVDEIDRQVKRGVMGFFALALPTGLLAFFLLPVPSTERPNPTGEVRALEWRVRETAVVAAAGGLAGAYLFGRKK